MLKKFLTVLCVVLMNLFAAAARRKTTPCCRTPMLLQTARNIR